MLWPFDDVNYRWTLYHKASDITSWLGIVHTNSVQTFPPITLIYIWENFVYHNDLMLNRRTIEPDLNCYFYSWCSEKFKALTGA